MATLAPKHDELADRLVAIDPLFETLKIEFGYPRPFKRPSGFVTLLKIILEQQVSLSSAAAVYRKLKTALGEVTPDNLLACSDDDLLQFGLSRQKRVYARALSEAIASGQFRLSTLRVLTNQEARRYLTQLKGIGNWTADVYLMMAENRPDVFPAGDLALQVSWQQIQGLDKKPTAEQLDEHALAWKPFRSVAAKWLWHAYLTRSEQA